MVCDRSNNKISNLEWVTRSENVSRSYQNNKEIKSNAIRLCRPVSARLLGALEWTSYSGGLMEAKSVLESIILTYVNVVKK